MYTYAYPRASLTVDAVVFYRTGDSIRVLLVQRAGEPFVGKWALPGGFINMDETLEAACKRELFEETGLELKRMEQFRAYDAVNRDPRGRTISVVYFAEIHSEKKAKGGDDASDARWFPVSDLPELAFDHRQILKEFLQYYVNS